VAIVPGAAGPFAPLGLRSLFNALTRFITTAIYCLAPGVSARRRDYRTRGGVHSPRGLPHFQLRGDPHFQLRGDPLAAPHAYPRGMPWSITLLSLFDRRFSLF
jgi:hypothetical protein